jgi:hypothetical protein
MHPMPWSEVTRMDQRMQRAADVLRDTDVITVVRARHGVSRQTGRPPDTCRCD